MLLGRHMEATVDHPQRPKDLLPQILIKTLTRNHLREVPANISREPIVPVLPRRKLKRQLCQPLHHRPKIATPHRPSPIHLTSEVPSLHRPALESISQTRLMRKQITNRHRTIRRPGHIVRILAAHPHLKIAPLRNKPTHRIRQMKQPPLMQLHHRHRSNRLRHRIDPKDRIGRHRLAQFPIHHPQSRTMNNRATTSNQRHAPGNPLRLDVTRKKKSIEPSQRRPVNARVTIH